MTMIENYLREVQASLRVDADRKRQIVDEMRSHLTDKIDDLQRADPLRPVADIEQEVLREFGNPRDLALAYEPEGTAVLTNQAGEIVLRFGKAMGRGAAAVGRNTGKLLKWTAVGLAFLLVLSIGVGAWAFYEVKPYIPSIIEQAEPSYSAGETCVTPCSGTPPADSFYVRDNAKTVKFSLSLSAAHTRSDTDAHKGNGTFQVIVTDSAGVIRYDRSFAMADEGSTSYDTQWSAVSGDWKVSYNFSEFVGYYHVETRVISFPWPGDNDPLA